MEFLHSALQSAIVVAAISAHQRGVPVARMARQLDDFTRYAGKPADEELGIGDARRVGDPRQPIVAGEAEGVLAPSIPMAQGGKKTSLHPRPRNSSDHAPRLSDPAQIGERPAATQ